MQDISFDGAAEYLRRLRHSRELTLERAADRLSISTAALSRMERNQREISRQDVTKVVEAYDLTPWESSLLHNAVGFMPPAPPAMPAESFRRYAVGLMTQLPYPAFLTDRFMYVLAWNGAIQAIWNPPAGQPIHMLDDLLSERVRAQMGPAWRSYVVNALWLFYQRSLPVAGHPGYRRLLRTLRDRHGEEFVSMWNEALERGYGAAPEQRDGGVRVNYMTPAGVIEYVVLQSMLTYPSPLELYMYVPYGRDNLERHREFEAKVDVYQLYEAPPPTP